MVTMSPLPSKHRVKPYKNSQWHERKALITQLYTKEHLSVDELVRNLATSGFYVKYGTELNIAG